MSKIRKSVDFSNIRPSSMPDLLLSGIFTTKISAIDVFPIERWNGLKTFATRFSFDIHFKGQILRRSIQLMHPFGIFPFPEFKTETMKNRAKEGWKAMIESCELREDEIEHIAYSFLEYPTQGTSSTAEYYRTLKKTMREADTLKEEMQRYIGRDCIIQIVDSGAKDHTGTRRNFSLEQFVTRESKAHLLHAYRYNLQDDFTISDIGAGVITMGYGGSK